MAARYFIDNFESSLPEVAGGATETFCSGIVRTVDMDAGVDVVCTGVVGMTGMTSGSVAIEVDWASPDAEGSIS